MLSMLDSNFTTNFNLSPELTSIITNVDDSTVEELDKFTDKFLSLNFLPNSKSGIIPGTRYFDKTLADIFEQFDKCNFSKESENFIKSLNEEYTKKCPKKGNDNKELIKSYREKYLEKFTDDNLLSPHDRFGDIKNNTISDEQFLEVRRMLPYLYENLLKGTKSATLEEFNRLKYSKSIMEKVRIHFNICISAIREELYLTVLCEIMCLEAKSEEFILFMKSSFGDLWELGENVINLHLEDVHNAYRTFKFEKFMNNKEHEWEDIFNNESQNTEKQKNLRKEWERIKSQTPYTKKYVPFIEFLLNPIISRKPYENLDLNKEYVQVYYMYLHDYSYEIANEMSKYSDLECFKEITISLIDSYSKKLFEIYVNKEKYKSEKYYKYKNRYKNLDNLFKPIISKIFRDIAENELKKNNNKDKK